MDEGKAAVLSAAMAGAVGVMGAMCAFGAGKASARGVVECVELQLSGERRPQVGRTVEPQPHGKTADLHPQFLLRKGSEFHQAMEWRQTR
ncbi:hypothetical protein ACIQXA_17630 [Streptomyces massasporeus]|uniref:hypothetical protein n=1 Tax=Streptomyces massasporeus TaxID=67324 RepID=UPI003827936B